MPSKDPIQRFEDILENINLIEEFTTVGFYFCQQGLEFDLMDAEVLLQLRVGRVAASDCKCLQKEYGGNTDAANASFCDFHEAISPKHHSRSANKAAVPPIARRRFNLSFAGTPLEISSASTA